MGWNVTFNFSGSECGKGAADIPGMCLLWLQAAGMQDLSVCPGAQFLSQVQSAELSVCSVLQLPLAGTFQDSCAGMGRRGLTEGKGNPLSGVIPEGICRDRSLLWLVLSHCVSRVETAKGEA